MNNSVFGTIKITKQLFHLLLYMNYKNYKTLYLIIWKVYISKLKEFRNRVECPRQCMVLTECFRRTYAYRAVVNFELGSSNKNTEKIETYST
jgi:hypothetical protein